MAPTAGVRQKLLRAALELAKRDALVFAACLFPLAGRAGELESARTMLRTGVQFHWRNPGYRDFAEFLACLSHDKRKKIKQERRRVREAGIEFTWLSGRDATPAQWDFFTLCYNRTYRQHHSTPYLNRAFFRRLAQVMPDNVLLTLAAREGGRSPPLNVLAATLWGRY
jgi:predicted N-acyltransferase